MAKFALFAKENEILVWAGKALSPADALIDFHNDVGIIGNEKSLAEIADDFYALELDDSAPTDTIDTAEEIKSEWVTGKPEFDLDRLEKVKD